MYVRENVDEILENNNDIEFRTTLRGDDEICLQVGKGRSDPFAHLQISLLLDLVIQVECKSHTKVGH